MEIVVLVPIQPCLLRHTPDLMVYLEGIETVRRNHHGDEVRIDGLPMKDNAIEWADLIFPWLIWLLERLKELVEGEVWFLALKQAIILNLWNVLTVVVGKAHESRK